MKKTKRKIHKTKVNVTDSIYRHHYHYSDGCEIEFTVQQIQRNHDVQKN